MLALQTLAVLATVIPSLCLSVCHTPVLCQSDCTVQFALSDSEMCLHRESKKGATLTMAITLSILDRFAKFFHCCKEQYIYKKNQYNATTTP